VLMCPESPAVIERVYAAPLREFGNFSLTQGADILL
jgi:hypothetical protein